MTTAVVGMLVMTGFTGTPQEFSIAPEKARALARADDGHAHGGDGHLGGFRTAVFRTGLARTARGWQGDIRNMHPQ